jgi:hypothetical protein
LLKVPVAVKVCFWPTEIVLAAGVTAIVCSLGDAAIARVASNAVHSAVATLTREDNVVRLEGNIETPLRYLDRVLGMSESDKRTTAY